MSDLPAPPVAVERAAWEVPVEMVISMAPPKIRKTIIQRQAQGEVVRQTANVVIRGKHYWGFIHWASGRTLSLPLDCWPGESRP